MPSRLGALKEGIAAQLDELFRSRPGAKAALVIFESLATFYADDKNTVVTTEKDLLDLERLMEIARDCHIDRPIKESYNTLRKKLLNLEVCFDKIKKKKRYTTKLNIYFSPAIGFNRIGASTGNERRSGGKGSRFPSDHMH